MKAEGGKPSLLKALKKSFGWDVFLGAVYKLLWSTFVLVGMCAPSALARVPVCT